MATRSDSWTIVSFLALCVLLSSLGWAAIILSGHVSGAAGHYVEGLMWAPAIAAFLTVYIRRLDVQSLGLAWGSGRYALLGYALPLAYGLIAYVLVWSLGGGAFPNPAAISAISAHLGWRLTEPGLFVAAYFPLIATTGMISSLAHALGEEIGWRGFLAPRMVGRFGFTTGSILTGLIWTAWHFPILLFADYNSGTPWWFSMPCFAVMVVSISIILTWLRLRSNSVWPCAIFHASHNLFIQAFFTPLTGARGSITPYLIDEFGIAVPCVAVIFAIVFWLRRNPSAGASVLTVAA